MHLYLFLYAKEYSCEVKVAQLYPTLCNPMNYIAFQSPLSMKFFRQEYWSG